MFEMERVLRGKQEYTHGKVYTFKCPTCGNVFKVDAPGEPMCTGPHAMLDEHVPVSMLLMSVVNLDKVEKFISPDAAVKRAASPLWVPGSV